MLERRGVRRVVKSIFICSVVRYDCGDMRQRNKSSPEDNARSIDSGVGVARIVNSLTLSFGTKRKIYLDDVVSSG